MIRKARLISASHVELSAGSDTRRVEKASIFSRKCALLAAVSVLTLSALGPLTANAQTVSDVIFSSQGNTIPQAGPSPNAVALAIATSFATDTTGSPLVVFDSADARSLAETTIIRGLIDIDQTNTGTAVGAINQQNTVVLTVRR